MQKDSKKKRNGFTLIELLIVVAIIAILAAIAVPNFLEAQVRAKVSRVKADQRTISIALESYSVDWNRVPPGTSEFSKVLNCAGITPCNATLAINYVYIPLTTPIAYITSVPKDPFISKGGTQAGQPVTFAGVDNFGYQSFPPSLRKIAAVARARDNGHNWMVFSRGPDKDQGGTTDYPTPLQTVGIEWTQNRRNHGIYDPTNGTISAGHIIRTDKGLLDVLGKAG